VIRLLAISSFLILSLYSLGSGIGDFHKNQLELEVLAVEMVSFDDVIQPKGIRPTAMLITILTGPFGGHRLYLGTNETVPIFYALTLGGGLGILPLIDFLCITFTKDLSRYYGNDKIFMWVPG
jgi:hypothetical protein